MGLCFSSSRGHNHNYQTMTVIRTQSRESSGSIEESNYKQHIVRAFVHSMYVLIRENYSKEYHLLLLIPTTINKIIETYYQHFECFSAEIETFKMRQLPKLERLVFDTSNVFHGDSKLYVKDWTNRMHAFIPRESFDDAIEQSALIETYCFKDFMNIDNIELIRQSKYNDDRKAIKLQNGAIYTQHQKKQNGWNQLYMFKLKRINIIEIDCGMEHSLYLDANGRVYSQGKNDEGCVCICCYTYLYQFSCIRTAVKSMWHCEDKEWCSGKRHLH